MTDKSTHSLLKYQTKICPVCDRVFTNRKRWNSRNLWNRIIYCSEGCRKRKGSKDSKNYTNAKK